MSAFKRQKMDSVDDLQKSLADVDTSKPQDMIADIKDDLDELDSDGGNDNTHEAEDRRQRRLM